MILLLLACAEEATVEILSPADGDRVCGTPLEVSLSVKGITLVDPYGGDAGAGTGHVDVMLNGQDAVMTDQPDFEIPEVADGEYQLKVELSGSDHEPIEPYAGDFIYVEVAEDACS